MRSEGNIVSHTEENVEDAERSGGALPDWGSYIGETVHSGALPAPDPFALALAPTWALALQGLSESNPDCGSETPPKVSEPGIDRRTRQKESLKKPSDKKIAANKQNARRSTGPKSRNGKKRTRQNARKHGLHAKYHLLRGEDAADYAQLEKDLYGQHRPKGAAERLIVNEMVGTYWGLVQASRADHVVRADLVAQAAGQHYSDIVSPGEIEGMKHYEYGYEKKLIAVGRTLGAIPAVVDQAHKAAVSDPDYIPAGLFIDRRRQSLLRVLKRLREELKILQDDRDAREEDEWRQRANHMAMRAPRRLMESEDGLNSGDVLYTKMKKQSQKK